LLRVELMWCSPVLGDMLRVMNKESSGRGVKIIFLDVDGVLNCTSSKPGGLEKRCVDLLDQLIAKSGAYVVLSSTWRYVKGGVARLKKTVKQLNLISCTPSLGEDERTREIWAWLEHNGKGLKRTPWDSKELDSGVELPYPWRLRKPVGVFSYVVIDDLGLMYENSGSIVRNRFIRTNVDTGLDQDDVTDALAMLQCQLTDDEWIERVSTVESSRKRESSCCLCFTLKKRKSKSPDFSYVALESVFFGDEKKEIETEKKEIGTEKKEIGT